jgi:hypothetical protein
MTRDAGQRGPAGADHRPDVRLAIGLAIVAVVSCGGLVAWALSVQHRLPDPVARHWGLDGAADGYSSLQTTLAITVGVAVVLVLGLGAVAVLSRLPDLARRSLAGVAGFTAVFMSVLVWDGLRGQLDLEEATLAPAPGPGIALGALAGILAAFAVAALATPQPMARAALQRPPADAPRLGRVDAMTAWESRLPSVDTSARVLALVVTIGFLVLAATVSWWLLSVGVVLAALLASAGRGRVRIDGDGLRVVSLGVTILHTPIEEVAAADVVDVDPFWEFGGWGLRIDAAGRTGLVTRKGPAVRIRRGDGSEVLITLGDSHRAAATLNSLADRAHGAT